MKAQKKDPKSSVEEISAVDFFTSLDLEKYSGPEFASPKLKMVEERFRKQAELKSKKAVHH